MTKQFIARAGKGKATHIGNENGNVTCGVKQHGQTAKGYIKNTGLRFERENITCKKCLAKFDAEVAEVEAAEEVVVEEVVAKETVKLTNERMQELVNERNEKGLRATVELMSKEELASYRINCTEAIERLEGKIKRTKVKGGSLQNLFI